MAPVLIIGATSSVASNVARILAARGRALVLVARDENKLRQLTSELGTSVLGTRLLDFAHHEEIEPLVHSLYEEFQEFDLALLAHGYLGNQLKSEESFSEAMAQISVNFVSAVAWLIPLAQRMEERGRGHLTVITSVAGDRGRPRNYTYGASKGALGLYLQGLRSRLYGNVTVTTIKLGPVDTPMTVDHDKNASFITSMQAANGIVCAIERHASEIYVPGFWRWVMGAVRTMPEPIFQRLKFLSGR